MGLFSYLGRSIVRPYVQVAQDLRKSGRNIKASYQELKEQKESAARKEVKYIEAPDAKKAFEALYEHGNWTEQELAQQLKVVRRAKWVFGFGSLMGLVCFVFFGLSSDSVLFTLITSLGLMLMSAILGARALQFAIFQTQLEERELISFKEFMGRKDFWRRVFS